MARFAHLYVPTGEICEVFNGVCFGTFATAADALAWEAVSINAAYRANYKIVPLPAELRDGVIEGEMANAALDLPVSYAPRSISDDDICSDCAECTYMPGDVSTCALHWPAVRDADGYAVSCVRFHKSI